MPIESPVDYSKISEIDLAYAAGIIDGEGCIHLWKNQYKTKGWQTNYGVSVTVLTADGVLAPWMGLTFGGSVRSYRDYSPSRVKMGVAGNNYCRRWQVASQAADTFLRAIRPYLKLKGAEADLAFEFRKLVGSPGVRITPENRATREAMWGRMKSLKLERVHA